MMSLALDSLVSAPLTTTFTLQRHRCREKPSRLGLKEIWTLDLEIIHQYGSKTNRYPFKLHRDLRFLGLLPMSTTENDCNYHTTLLEAPPQDNPRSRGDTPRLRAYLQAFLHHIKL